MATGNLLRKYRGHIDSISSLAFSPDGNLIVAGSGNGVTLLWEVKPPRAVIVAGGGNFAGNPIAQQTRELGAYAYRVLKGRGYEKQNIKYLTAFGPTDTSDSSRPFHDVDGDGFNDASVWATLDNLHNVLTGDFATSAGRLLLLLMDHGYRTQDFAAFRVNENQVLPSTTLKEWLDDLQSTSTVGGGSGGMRVAGLPEMAASSPEPPPLDSRRLTLTQYATGARAYHVPEVTLVVESCYSGQFVEDCKGAPEGAKRIVIASTGPRNEAVMMPPPDLTSFMQQFLSSAYMGNSLGEAWRAGRRFFEAFPLGGQVPQLDDQTTGTAAADREFFGATWTYGVQSTEDINRFFPVFDSWTTDTTVSPGAPVHLWARLLEGQSPREVVAVVRPPAPPVISGDPVTALPHVALAQNPSDPRLWEADTDPTLLSARGTYVVSFQARFDYERLANPVFTHLTVSEGVDPDAVVIRAILAVGDSADTTLSANLAALGAYAYPIYLHRFQDNQGQRHPEWIEYLTADPGDPGRDGPPSAAGVIGAIDNLPAETGRLYAHLIGDSDTSGVVRLADGELLDAAALDAALDRLQARQACTVALIVDAPHAGAFLPLCRATAGQQRAVFAGSGAAQTALFLPPPALSSFSQKLLGSAYQGNPLLEGFRAAREFFQQVAPGAIAPELDDNGDGVFDAADGELAQTLYLGRRYAFAGDRAAGLPFIVGLSLPQSIGSTQPVTVTARLMEGVAPLRVFGQLAAPVAEQAGPIRSLREIELGRTGPASWNWSATFTAPEPLGFYPLIVYAVYPDGAQTKLSEPAFSGLRVSLATGADWMLYE